MASHPATSSVSLTRAEIEEAIDSGDPWLCRNLLALALIRPVAVSETAATELAQDWKDIFEVYRKQGCSDAWLYQQIEAHARRASRSATRRTDLAEQLYALRKYPHDLRLSLPRYEEGWNDALEAAAKLAPKENQ